MQPLPRRPASSHRDPTRSSFRRTHPDHPSYFRCHQNVLILNGLGCHSLDENAEVHYTSNEPPSYFEVVAPPYLVSHGILPSYPLPSFDYGAVYPSAPSEAPEIFPCASSPVTELTIEQQYFSGRPTVFPKKDFDPAKDAVKIRKAVKGSDIDCMCLISILSKRSTEQRVKISEKYVEVNNKDIESDLTKSGYGNFEVLVILSLEYLQDTIAFALYEYIQGLDTDENILIQGIVSYPNSFMREISRSYRKQFDADVTIELFRRRRGEFRTILMILLQGIRDENDTINMIEIWEDTDNLYKACEIPFSPDTEIFTRTLTKRSFAQIKQITQCFQMKYGISLEQYINNGKFGGYKDTLKAIVRYATDKDDLLSEWFHRTLQEAVTNDWVLMQLTLGRSEIDLQDVKSVYCKKYGKSLLKSISSATSGKYKKFLMAIVGCQ